MFFYEVILGWTLRDALLQIVLTVSTLGGTANPHDAALPVAKWFDIFFILTIILVGLWGVSLFIEAIVSGEWVYYWGARRMERAIEELSCHYIICGFGRMGEEIARQFVRVKQPFVVLEHNPSKVPFLEASPYLFVKGDARDDDQLLKAGIERARGLIAVAATDEENVYITLSARVLNPNLYIVTRSSHSAGEAKLTRAGADRVVSPYIIGGRRIAQAVLRPTVIEFLDTVVHGEQMKLLLEEITVDEASPVCRKTVGEYADVEALGVHLLGIATSTGHIIMRGSSSHVVTPGDTFILLGEPEELQQAIKLLTGREKTIVDPVITV